MKDKNTLPAYHHISRYGKWVKGGICFLSFLFFFGCTEHQEHQNVPQSHSSLTAHMRTTYNTENARFAFSEKQTLFLSPNSTKKVAVTLSSDYSPVTSAEFSVSFDPTFLRIEDIVPAEKMVLFAKHIDVEHGAFSATIAIPEGMIGKNIPLVFVTLAPAEKVGETILSFRNESLSALLSDAKNTNIAQKHNLSPLVVSVTP